MHPVRSRPLDPILHRRRKRCELFFRYQVIRITRCCHDQYATLLLKKDGSGQHALLPDRRTYVSQGDACRVPDDCAPWTVLRDDDELRHAR